MTAYGRQFEDQAEEQLAYLGNNMAGLQTIGTASATVGSVRAAANPQVEVPVIRAMAELGE
jgi:hypothetical protein